jgi:hypothetical protein
MRNTRIITAAFGVLILGMPLLPVLAQDHSGLDQQSPKMKMMMSGMMECQTRCDQMSASMADLTGSLNAARASNDVSELHAALDRVQAGLTKMEEEMKSCHAKMHEGMQHEGMQHDSMQHEGMPR